jgi:Fe-S cluster assembly protein SufB
MEWIDGNIGSKVTMKYPSCVLAGANSHGEIISLAMAGENQTQHTGTKMIHIGRNTTSRVVSKSIVKDGGNTTYLGKIDMKPTAHYAQSSINCDGIIADNISKAYTYPVNVCSNSTSRIQHEASVSKIDQEKVFYLTSRGIPEDVAIGMIVKGFIDPVIKKLPLEFALELIKLIDLEMEGSVG